MKAMAIIKYVFTSIGLAMLIGAWYLYSSTQEFIGNALVTEGTVTELVRSRSSDSTTYSPVVEFRTDDGTLIEFTSSSASNPPSYTRGEAVTVYYYADRPEQAKVSGFFSLWGLASILGGMGSVFFLIGFSIIWFSKRREDEVAYLQRKGTPVRAKFQGVERNTSLRVNGRNPYRIYAQWINPRTNELHIFKSENIWFDPESYINREELNVLIDQMDPEKHYMDISFLPKLAD